MARLKRRTTLIAEHGLSSCRTSLPEKKYAGQRLLVPKRQSRKTEKEKANEKAARQRDGLFFQGRIVPTEVKPSKLSGEILWAGKAGCQGIFGK
ncbi:MAG: hypothetical protein JST79_11985 [Acidobacteria bacterium]|nr:hypothetical protein [Acidobacteriota bacterium]